MGYDRLADTLRGAAPVALPGLVDAIERWQHLSVTELGVASTEVAARFRRWLEDPVNSGRPPREAPDYLDRMAIETILERRLFCE